MTQAMPVTTVTVAKMKVKTTALTMISMIIWIEARFFFRSHTTNGIYFYHFLSIQWLSGVCRMTTYLVIYLFILFKQSSVFRRFLTMPRWVLVVLLFGLCYVDGPYRWHGTTHSASIAFPGLQGVLIQKLICEEQEKPLCWTDTCNHMYINPYWFKTILAFCRFFFRQTWGL